MQNVSDTIFTLGTAAVMAVLSLSAFSRTDAGDPTSGWRDGAYQRGFETRFEQSIPASEGAVALWAAARWALFGEPASGAVAGREGWLFTAEELTEPAAPRAFAPALREVSNQLALRGIRLVPVIVPDKVRMHAHRLPRGRSAGFALRYDRALRTIAQSGLPVIDLRPALDFDQSYMRTDTHWSPEGARRAAQAIAVRLHMTGIARVPVQTRASGPRDFEGDLLSYVATGALRPHVGPSAETIATFETTVDAGSGLFGEAQIPVALVGTSYSAKAAFHFEGFLKQALQADVVNVSRVGQGPFVPMDAFLGELNQMTSLPALVIWEIPERFLTTRSLLQ